MNRVIFKPGGWVQTAVERLTQFIITDTAKPTEQRVIKGAWQGKRPNNKHIGQQACEQEELRGFTKKQVYTKRFSRAYQNQSAEGVSFTSCNNPNLSASSPSATSPSPSQDLQPRLAGEAE